MTCTSKSTDPITGVVTLGLFHTRCERNCSPGSCAIRLTRVEQGVKDEAIFIREEYACSNCFPEEKELTQLKQMWVGFKGRQMTAIHLNHPPTKEIETFLKKHGVELEYYVRGGEAREKDG